MSKILRSLARLMILFVLALPTWAGTPFYHQGKIVELDFALSSNLSLAVEQLLLPDPTLDVDRLLPEEAHLLSVERIGNSAIIRLYLPPSFLARSVDDDLLEKLSRQLDLTTESFDPPLRSFYFTVADPHQPGRFINLSAFIHSPPLPSRTHGSTLSKAPLVRRRTPETEGVQGNPTYPLSNKVLFISQCHGWIDYNNANAWQTQRGITHGIVEDFVNPEAVNQYLLTYLENAGATVFTLRERDLNESMVIVDDGDGMSSPGNGTYVESGDAGAFSTSGQAAFANFEAPYPYSEDPFRDNGGSDRLLTTSPTETARATFTPVFSESGFYQVYVSYTRNGALRASDAHYVVQHTGGETHFLVNQERHGWTWVPLGRFHFAAGSEGSVALLNDSSEVGETVSADAVRFGGGPGDIEGEFHSIVSSHPRWEEGALPNTQYMGAPASVWGSGDVTARSKFAAWEHFSTEDSVYVSWHSNAFDGSARGTSSYIYSSNPPDGSYDPNQSVPGSAALMNAIHDEIINDIRGSWDPSWTDRGYRSAYFGEINPSHNNEMPSTLLEVAFHDNATDAGFLAHPVFRHDLARAIYQGIVKYFAGRDQLSPKLIPEPPLAPWARSDDPGQITVGWSASPTDGGGVLGDAAISYRVYRSNNGRGFDGGLPVAETSTTFSGLSPGDIAYFRVTAVNEGGESLPSETLALRVRTGEEHRLLIVNGFDRLDRGLLVDQNQPDLGGPTDRMFLDVMNRFNYGIEFAESLRNFNLRFDFSSNEAVTDSTVILDDYSAVLWILGEESTADQTFSPEEQAVVGAYLDQGGALFVSGAEVGWDLDFLGSTSDQDFYNTYLGSHFVADDANVFEASGSVGTLFENLGVIAFEDGTHGSYEVEYPDVVGAEPGAETCMDYSNGLEAGVQWDAGTFKVVNLGFPFESVYPSNAREDLMGAVLDFFHLPFINPIFEDGFESGDVSLWSEATTGNP